MQQNSSYKGWSFYRSPNIQFHKLQYSPLIYQNFNLFISNETVDFQPQIINVNKVNPNEGLCVSEVKEIKECNSDLNSDGKRSDKIMTHKLDLKRENIFLQNLGTPCLKPQENIINTYCMKNDDFQKFRCSFGPTSSSNKSSIFTKSLIKNIVNPNSVESKKKYETKIIIQDEKKIDQISNPVKEDTINVISSCDEESHDDEDWTPTEKKQLLCNKRNKEKLSIHTQTNINVDKDLIKKSVHYALNLITRVKVKKARINIKKFNDFLLPKENLKISFKKQFENKKFFDLRKKINEYILKRFEKPDNENLNDIGSQNQDVQDVLKQNLNFCDNPKDIYNYLIKLLGEEVSHLTTIKDDKSDSYYEQYSICNSIYFLIRPISKITYSGGKNSKPNNENVEKNKNNIKKTSLNDAKQFICHVCYQNFLNGQALGGHMSRTHPFHSEKYKLKKEIRQSRTAFRQALNEAKTELLKRYNLSYVNLSKGKENKKMIKEIIFANKDEYRSILLEIKKKLNIQTESNNKKAKICK